MNTAKIKEHFSKHWLKYLIGVLLLILAYRFIRTQIKNKPKHDLAGGPIPPEWDDLDWNKKICLGDNDYYASVLSSIASIGPQFMTIAGPAGGTDYQSWGVPYGSPFNQPLKNHIDYHWNIAKQNPNYSGWFFDHDTYDGGNCITLNELWHIAQNL